MKSILWGIENQDRFTIILIVVVYLIYARHQTPKMYVSKIRCENAKSLQKESMLSLNYAVGYVLIVDYLKKTISHNKTNANIGEMPTDHEYEVGFFR